MKEGMIIKCVSPGLELKKNVIRKATCVVSLGPEKAVEEEKEEEEVEGEEAPVAAGAAAGEASEENEEEATEEKTEGGEDAAA